MTDPEPAAATIAGAAQAIPDEDVEIVHNIEGTPSIYIDGAQGFMAVNGIVRVNCFHMVQHFGASAKESKMKKVFNLQLVMTPAVAGKLATWIMQYVKGLEEKEAQEPSKPAKKAE